MQIIRARKPSLSLDLAPLIDVVFQLLIFFMLTSAFTSPAMKIDLPRAASGEQSQQNQIVIGVDESGQLTLNGRPSSLADLKNDLRDLLADDPDKPIQLHGDKNMAYRYFVEVMDVARLAGAKQINIVHQK